MLKTENAADEEVRAGALACMSSLRIIEEFGNLQHPDWEPEVCYSVQKQAISAALLAAGEMPKRAQGAVMALAEYIFVCHLAGVPNIGVWKPDAAMTAAEKASNLMARCGEDIE